MGGHQHILIVDDDAGIRDTIAEILGLEGFGVSLAREGLEGLLRIQERRPDVIVLDRFMPGLDGLRFVERLRADPLTRDIPVVLMTGLAPDAGQFPLPVQAVLAKPFEVEEFLATLRRLAPRP